jgi:hypothetical protein
MLTQCDRADDGGNIPETEKEEVAVTGTQNPEEIPADEPPQPEETPTVEEAEEPVDTSFDRVYARAACPSPEKAGKEDVDDIVGKWKLMLEITGDDVTDRSCEEIVYHFGEDGTLTVSGSSAEKKESVYAYAPFPLCPACLPLNPKPNLKMGDAEAVYCQISLSKMVVYPQTAYTDLGIAYPDQEFKTLFSRIE